jgi:hypothetical protein
MLEKSEKTSRIQRRDIHVRKVVTTHPPWKKVPERMLK